MTQITKILIANRGEIACRVIRTAREMGIATVAVYSDADRDALHVRMADESVHIGPAPAAESYLLIDRIIDAAKATGADAIHPGYGFLSENPGFVRACEKAGIIFIGPSAEAMEAMGLKDAAKALMSEAGVPVTPGYQGDDQDPDFLAEQAAKIGYPVLIKAVAGGGGKGMRKVEDPDDFKAALASCQREAASSFGNDHVLIEKFITSPRHIEVQIFGDRSGHVIHLFERDCSLQRRHQKVIEEAPAPGMTDEVRHAMTDAAIRAAQAVDYVGAGTVEFIVDGSGALRPDGFWFMEMNTRLQVEHPVTEEITGLDLVALQIRVARGESLPAQGDIKIDGHAIEARLYAEDPANDFMPAPGQFTRFDLAEWPDSDGGTTRVDTGIETLGRVSLFYDAMVAKLIAHAEDRNAAISLLGNMIDSSSVAGTKTNLNFLKQLLSLDEFLGGNMSTGLIAQKMGGLDLGSSELTDWDYALATQCLISQLGGRVSTRKRLQMGRPSSPFAELTAWRLNGPSQSTFLFMQGDQVLPVLVTNIAPSHINMVINGRAVSVPDTVVNATITDDAVTLILEKDNTTVRRLVPRYAPGGNSALASGNSVTSPMPGKVISVLVEPGATVAADQPLIILEAMKMEMTLKSPRDGIVAEIGAAEGDLVDDGQALVTLEES